MGFWRFMKYMLVYDWLFGHHRDDTYGTHRSSGHQHYTDCFHDDCGCGCDLYDHEDYIQQDFDDDLDWDMLDDDF